MDLQLQDKVFLITGGAKGIGKGIVRELSKEGAVPVIVGNNAADNQKLADDITTAGGQVYEVLTELTSPEQCASAVKQVVSTFGRIDGLVNNAGINDGVGLEKGCYEDFVKSLRANVIHYYTMAHVALPELIKTKGSILNISSKTAETGQGNTSGYAAANGGRNALTREWAVELLKYGIRVNAIVVAECWTPQYADWIRTLPDSDHKLTEIANRIPLGNRMTTIEEIGATAAFLLSERSSHTTGQLIHVDGGYVHLDRGLVHAM